LPNAEELKQHIPEDILPKEFGGTGSSFDELHGKPKIIYLYTG
jgi:hypothetical protein